jgi:hypothetical protein
MRNERIFIGASASGVEIYLKVYCFFIY